MGKRGVKEKVFGFLKSDKKKERDEVLDKLKEMAKSHEEAVSEKPIEKVSKKKVIKKGLIEKKLVKKISKKLKKIFKVSSKKIPKKKTIKKKLAVKKPSALTLVKPIENPIISPNKRNGWESWQTFNPGAVLLDEKIHFLYRAIGHDGISRLGYANSDDGLTISERHPEPAYEHVSSTSKAPSFNIYSYSSGGSWGGCEDPRIVYIDEDDFLYMTYTACDGGLRVALTSIKVRDFLKGKWKWKPPKLISPPGEVHKNWVIFPEKIKGKYAILHSINPEISIHYTDSLDFKDGEYIESCYGGKKEGKSWDNWIRGVGPPPIKTKEGWLVFYHAIDKEDPGKYKVGAMLLDLKNPTKILCRSKEPLLEPNEDYENNGFKAGIVYASGAVVKDGILLVYYGAADSYVCVAYNDLEKFLGYLKKGIKPKLKKKRVKKKK